MSSVKELFSEIKKNKRASNDKGNILILKNIPDSNFNVKKYFPDSRSHKVRHNKFGATFLVTFKTPEAAEKASRVEIKVDDKAVKIEFPTSKGKKPKIENSEIKVKEDEKILGRVFSWKSVKRVKISVRHGIKKLRTLANACGEEKKKSRLELELLLLKTLNQFLDSRDNKTFLQNTKAYYPLMDDCLKEKEVQQVRKDIHQVLQAELNMVRNHLLVAKLKLKFQKSFKADRHLLECATRYFLGIHSARFRDVSEDKSKKEETEEKESPEREIQEIKVEKIKEKESKSKEPTVKRNKKKIKEKMSKPKESPVKTIKKKTNKRYFKL